MTINESQPIFPLPSQYQPLFDLVGAKNSAALEKVLRCSPFVADLWLANNNWCQDFFSQYSGPDWQLVSFVWQQNEGESIFMQHIRQWRMEQMAIIAARDILNVNDTAQTCRWVSELADSAITEAQRFATQDTLAQAQYIDKLTFKELPSLITVGMGKLGGYELNYSSDIDVMFFYDDPEQLIAGVEWPVLFARIVQKIIKYIGSVTPDGFVFRVDVRLRPFGDSGALALSLAAAENYYTTHGRDWERYALIKARAVTGSDDAKKALYSIFKPFVYRRYLDFGSIDALRDLKARIVSSYSENKIKDNIKLGRGGIREIEFIFQLLQLIYAGKDPEFRTASLVKAAGVAVTKDLITQIKVDRLLKAYWFLRKAENNVQIMRDQQIHHLPAIQEDQDRLSLAMGFNSYLEFLHELEGHQAHVVQSFDGLLYSEDEDTVDFEYEKRIWLNVEGHAAKQAAEQMGYQQVDLLLEQLLLLKNASIVKRMSQIALKRLDEFILVLIRQLAVIEEYEEHADIVWARLQFFIRQIALRSVYLVMLTERPEVLSSLVRLMIKSAWISESISQHPAMLDMLLEPLVNDRFSKVALQHVLQAELLHADDVEKQMEALRKFKHEIVMKIACADLNNVLPLMQVSDSLTYLSESLLDESLTMAKKPLVDTYGEPSYVDDSGQIGQANMAVIGYGKMGGLELGYNSDLDIVFLHDSAGQKEYTDGDKSIDNTTFFARWVQKTLHYLNTLTRDGRLYEVDMRLRPNGASGTLATRFSGFATYLERDAWLWELQALVRARFVAGNTSLGERFENLRREILCLERDGGKVKSEVVEMRLRMRKELGSNNPRNSANGTYRKIKSEKISEFDLKHDFGGIADIEFMVQYAVLANAALTPALASYTDNIRLLEIMGEHDYLNRQDAQSLIAAYQLFRQTIHHRSLQNQGSHITNMSSELADAIDTVSVIWLNTMN